MNASKLAAHPIPDHMPHVKLPKAEALQCTHLKLSVHVWQHALACTEHDAWHAV